MKIKRNAAFRLFAYGKDKNRYQIRFPRMTDLMAEDGLPAPEYRTEGFFTTVLYKKRAGHTCPHASQSPDIIC